MATAVIGSHNYVRINMTTLTGGGTVSVTYEGFSTDPSAAVGASGLPAGGNLDMANFLLTNIGNAGTDFTASGGLNLAGGLNPVGAITVGGTGYVEVPAITYFRWTGRSRIYSPSDNIIMLTNSGVTGFSGIMLGGTGTGFTGLYTHPPIASQPQGIAILRADGSQQTFANLGAAGNGYFIYCADCTKATPCAGGGTGAIAKRLNSVWDCD